MSLTGLKALGSDSIVAILLQVMSNAQTRGQLEDDRFEIGIDMTAETADSSRLERS